MRILMFHTNNASFNTLNIFYEKLAGEFQKKGHETSFIDLMDDGAISELYRRLDTRKYDIVFSINSIGEGGIRLPNGKNIYDNFHIPFLEMLLDHPMDHIGYILNSGNDFHLTYCDRDHRAFIEDYCPRVKSCHFVEEVGGLEPEDTSFTMDDFISRPFNGVFIGNHMDLAEGDTYLMSLPFNLRMIAADMIDYMLEYRDVHAAAAMRKILDDHGLKELYGEDFAKTCGLLSRVTYYVRSYVREEIVRYIMESGISFDIFGGGWEQIKDQQPNNVKIHKGVPYPQTADIYGKARIALNVSPWFRNGSHDRIPTVLMNGAVMLTDHTILLDEKYLSMPESERFMVFYDISRPQDIPGMISGLTSDPDRLYKMSESGRKYANKNLTWEKTAERILDIISHLLHMHGKQIIQ